VYCGWIHAGHCDGSLKDSLKQNLDAIYKDFIDCKRPTVHSSEMHASSTPTSPPSTSLPTKDGEDSACFTKVNSGFANANTPAKSVAIPVPKHASGNTTGTVVSIVPKKRPQQDDHLASCDELPPSEPPSKQYRAQSHTATKGYTIPRHIKKESLSPTTPPAQSMPDFDLEFSEYDSEMYEFAKAVDEAYKKGGSPAAKIAADQVEKQQAERYKKQI
jgi:hypothetical protein